MKAGGVGDVLRTGKGVVGRRTTCSTSSSFADKRRPDRPWIVWDRLASSSRTARCYWDNLGSLSLSTHGKGASHPSERIDAGGE